MKHGKSWGIVVALILTPICALGFLSANRQSKIEFDYLGAERLAREYMKVIDDGDLRSQMELVSRDPNVSSTIMGETWHGWDAIKTRSEIYVPYSKKIRNVLGKIDVIALGSSAAVVVVPFRSERRQASDQSIPEFEQSLTLVLKQTPQGWRMIHEHVSAKISPTPSPK